MISFALVISRTPQFHKMKFQTFSKWQSWKNKKTRLLFRMGWISNQDYEFLT